MASPSAELVLKKPDAIYSTSNTDTRLNVQNGRVNLVASNPSPTEYNFGYLFSSSSAVYSWNFDLENLTADVFNVNNSASSGRINIDTINYVNAPAFNSNEAIAFINKYLLDGAVYYSKSIKVLNGTTQNLQLMLSDANASDRGSFVYDLYRTEGFFEDTIYSYVRFNQEFYKNYSVITVFGSLELDSLDNPYDSIKFVLRKNTVSEEARRSSLGDSFFYVLNNNNVDRSRNVNFQFSKNSDIFRIQDDFNNSNIIVPNNMLMASQLLTV